MDFIKKYSSWLLILFLCLFLFNGMKSCSKGRTIKKLERTIEQKDSIIQSKEDSIKTLNYEIKVLNAEKAGVEKNVELQNEAIKKISESKKNINVTVKK